MEELYNRECITEEAAYIGQEDETKIDSKGPTNTRSKFDNALKQLKTRK